MEGWLYRYSFKNFYIFHRLQILYVLLIKRKMKGKYFFILILIKVISKILLFKRTDLSMKYKSGPVVVFQLKIHFFQGCV